jgi:sigma-B regulation protein RsbU (phosphoserine phosphatase)
MIFAILDTAQGTLTFARAGHEPLIAYSRTADSMRLLAPDGIALGLVPEGEFSVLCDQALTLDEGDVAVLYTDGVVEARNRKEKEYGPDRLLEVLRTHIDTPAKDLIHTLVTDVRHFARDGRQADDITLVVLKCNERTRGAASYPQAAPAVPARLEQEGNIETV